MRMAVQVAQSYIHPYVLIKKVGKAKAPACVPVQDTGDFPVCIGSARRSIAIAGTGTTP